MPWIFRAAPALLVRGGAILVLKLGHIDARLALLEGHCTPVRHFRARVCGVAQPRIS